MVRFLEHHEPDLEIDALDIDPEMPRLAADYFGTHPDEKRRFLVADGYDFIRSSPRPVRRHLHGRLPQPLERDRRRRHTPRAEEGAVLRGDAGAPAPPVASSPSISTTTSARTTTSRRSRRRFPRRISFPSGRLPSRSSWRPWRPSASPAKSCSRPERPWTSASTRPSPSQRSRVASSPRAGAPPRRGSAAHPPPSATPSPRSPPGCRPGSWRWSSPTSSLSRSLPVDLPRAGACAPSPWRSWRASSPPPCSWAGSSGSSAMPASWA